MRVCARACVLAEREWGGGLKDAEIPSKTTKDFPPLLHSGWSCIHFVISLAHPRAPERILHNFLRSQSAPRLVSASQTNQNQHELTRRGFPTSECNFGNPVTFPPKVRDRLQVDHKRQHQSTVVRGAKPTPRRKRKTRAALAQRNVR